MIAVQMRGRIAMMMVGNGAMFASAAVHWAAGPCGSREGRGWWIFFGIVSLIGGVVITAVPVESVTALAVLVGIWFIVQGLFEITGAFMLRHEASKSQTSVVGRPGEGAAAL